MKPHLRWIAIAVVLGGLFASRTASAELLHGQYRFPGKLMLGARPLGVQVFLTSSSGVGALGLGTYKLALDFSGKLLDLPKMTLWLGGEFNLGGAANLAQIEFGIFAMLTLEKLIANIPLVPMVMAGLTAPINVFYAGNFSQTLGGFGVKIGGGAYYFLLKQLGVGGEMHFAFAGAFGGAGGSAWAGFWDLVAGVRVAF